MSAGFDDFFDAFAGAYLREDGVVAGAFAVPAVVFGPGDTLVCRSRAEVAEWLATERARLAGAGVKALAWANLEVRSVGEHQHHVTVRWEHDETDTVYLLRGEPPEALVTGVVTSR
ncbi:MAG: hypothetical protein AAF602_32515 [Myxococcota bacterium]